MRRNRLFVVWVSLVASAARCTCGTDLSGDHFSCSSDADCAGTDRCIAGVCGPGEADAGGIDSGISDAGTASDGGDAGAITDAGSVDAGSDGGGRDAGRVDGGTDAGPTEIVLVQHGSALGAAGTTASLVSYAFQNPTHPGDLLVVVGGWYPVTDVTFLPTDNYGNKFTYILDAGPDQGVIVYYAQGIDGGSGHAVTWSIDGGTPLSLCVAEFSGVSATNAYTGLVQFGNGTTAAPIAGPIAPPVGGTLIFGALAHDGTVKTDAGMGFTLLDIATDDANNFNPAADEYLVTVGTPASYATFTLSASQIWADIVVAFNPGP